MILSDGEIREELLNGDLEITGVNDIYKGPSSVDMHLDNKARIFKRNSQSFIRLDDNIKDNFIEHNDWDEIIIHPGKFYILSTVERFELPDDLVGFVQGRSSIARAGISIHMAGFVDAGFKGNITLEVTNFTNCPIIVPKNTRIGQIVFARMGKKAEIPYGMKKDSKYQNQSGPTITSIHKDYKHD